MKPAPFEYHAPETVDDVVGLLTEHGDEAKPLAGGQSLVPMLAMRLTRFEHLVDLQRVAPLAGVARENGYLRVGAMTRQRELERNPAVGEAVPLLARATPLVGHFQIRNRGTVGGSLAHADPASEYPAVAVALDAEFEIAGAAGTRRATGSEFFVSTWTTCLEADEVLIAARFPVWEGRTGFAVDEVARRHGDFALAGVTCAVTVDEGGAVTRAGIGLFGMGSTPVRAVAAEAALTGSRAGDVDLEDVGALAVRDAEPLDDVHATGVYRRSVGGHLVTRVVAQALAEATGE